MASMTREEYLKAGFTEDEINKELGVEKTSVLQDIGSGASRLAGVLVGTANAPLAFIKGAMNAPYHSPEEWKKIPWYEKPIVNLGAGFVSAKQSVADKGTFGETYDTYYKGVTGSDIEKDFGKGGANVIKFGLDLAMDPMFGPAMAVDLAAKGVRTAGQFVKYLRTGAVEQGAKAVMDVPKGTAADVVKLEGIEQAEATKIAELTQAEKEAAQNRLLDVLKKQNELARIAEAEDAAAVYGQSTLHGGKPLDIGTESQIETLSRLKEEVFNDKKAAGQIDNFVTALDENVGSYGSGLVSDAMNPMRTFPSAGGLVAGVETDEEGNLSYDIKKGLMGTVAVAGGLKVSGLFKTAKTTAGIVDLSAMKPEAQAVGEMYNKTIAAMTERETLTWTKFKEAFTRGILDTSGNLKRDLTFLDSDFGKEVVMRKELVAGASARASSMMQTYNSVIFDGLDVANRRLLDSIIQSKRTIAIDEYKGLGTVKHPDGLTGVEHMTYLDELQKTLPGNVFADIEARAGIYFDSMQEQLKMRFDEGLISKESFDALSKEIYSPRQFLQHLDDATTFIRSKKVSVPEGQIKALDEGSMNLLMNDSQSLLSQVVARSQDMIFRNRANKALLDFAEAVPGNGIVRAAKVSGGNLKFEELPSGYESVNAIVDGEIQSMIMPKGMAAEWVQNDPLVNQQLAKVLQWMTGSNILKATATGYNPAFALANIPRDLGLIWQSQTQYSKHLPVAMGQMAVDMVQVLPDVLKRTGRVERFVEDGGGMNLMTYYGRFSGEGQVGEKISDIGKVLGWVGETSEIWTRMALRERAIKNGASEIEATWAARKYLDFSQGGNIIKGLDNGLPYLNAGVQATRSMLKGAAENPGVFAYKAAQVMTLAGGLYMANYHTNPDCWKEVSDREREANFIITTPFSYTDSNGQNRHFYFKIAKDQGQRMFTALIDSAMQYYYEGKSPSKQMVMALGDLVNSPVPPTLNALASYALNMDTYTQEPVWKGPKVEPGEEYNTYTNPLSKPFGMVGMSPARTQAAFGDIVASNNFYTGLVGWGAKEIFASLDPQSAAKTNTEIIMSAPGMQRLMSQTSPYSQWRDDVEKAKIDETTRRFRQSRDIDKLTEAYAKTKDPGIRDQIIAYVQQQSETDQERLTNRVTHHMETAQLPDRQWWVSTGALPPEARAAMFRKRFDRETQEVKQQMLETADKLSGYVSDDFIDALEKGRTQ